MTKSESTWPPAMPAWPRLTETLEHRGTFWVCQSCGYSLPGRYDLQIWQEADDRDRFESRYVVLCSACADHLIEKHPRLYRQVIANEPAPGVMAICKACGHREGSRCASPLLLSNGGSGLAFRAPDSTVHLSYRDKSGKRCGGWERHWHEPMGEGDCPGREVR